MEYRAKGSKPTPGADDEFKVKNGSKTLIYKKKEATPTAVDEE